MSIICPLQNFAVKKLMHWEQVRPYVTQRFGENPQMYLPLGLKAHSGTDYRAAEGTDVFAPMQGYVKVKDSGRQGYGLHVKIRFYDKEVVLGHLFRVLVKDGFVHMGQKIAETGASGFGTGAHLHFGIRNIDSKSLEPLFKQPVVNYNNGYLGYFDPLPLTIQWKGTYDILTL